MTRLSYAEVSRRAALKELRGDRPSILIRLYRQIRKAFQREFILDPKNGQLRLKRLWE